MNIYLGICGLIWVCLVSVAWAVVAKRVLYINDYLEEYHREIQALPDERQKDEVAK